MAANDKKEQLAVLQDQMERCTSCPLRQGCKAPVGWYGNPDSPFVTKVLEMEQDLLTSQGERASIIISKDGDVITFEDYLEKIRNEK